MSNVASALQSGNLEKGVLAWSASGRSITGCFVARFVPD
jgi:hypothetical protein